LLKTGIWPKAIAHRSLGPRPRGVFDNGRPIDLAKGHIQRRKMGVNMAYGQSVG
jgi:hypothetical protein